MIYLRQIRKSRNMTMKELGKKVGVSEAAIGYYETEKRTISYEMLLKLSEALDCTVNDIIYGEKIPVTTKDDGQEEKYEEIKQIFDALTNENAESLKDYALYLLQRQKSQDVQ